MMVEAVNVTLSRIRRPQILLLEFLQRTEKFYHDGEMWKDLEEIVTAKVATYEGLVDEWMGGQVDTQITQDRLN